MSWVIEEWWSLVLRSDVKRESKNGFVSKKPLHNHSDCSRDIQRGHSLSRETPSSEGQRHESHDVKEPFTRTHSGFLAQCAPGLGEETEAESAKAAGREGSREEPRDKTGSKTMAFL